MMNDVRLVLAKNLVMALEKGNEPEVQSILEEIVDKRESQMFHEVGRLTRQLHDTMESMCIDSSIVEMTKNDIPNAKERLQYVISMTEKAADQTLNVIETLLPASKELNEEAELLLGKWERFLDKEMPFQEFKAMTGEITHYFQMSRESLQKIQEGLNEILMTQGFQDITGQIIKKVIVLVQDVETSLVELIRISGTKSKEVKESNEPGLPGPVVPGIDDKAGDVAANQDDVDDLLSSLGF